MNQVIIDVERCKECGYCVNFSPSQALAIGSVINKRGYYPPVFDGAKCIACGVCARVCPDAAIEVMKEN